MIKIDKGPSPKNLARTHARRSLAMKNAFDTNSDDYINNNVSFKFGNAYNTTEVRDLLIKKQFNKCCFSEAKFVGDYSDVEHFRPKGRVDDFTTNVGMYPGYYWVAYDWDNLFLSKTRPNSSQKRNYFPLFKEANRNRSHKDIFSEEPKLIDPGKEDPRKFINFYLHEPKSIDVNGRGQFNIDFFDLRHSEFEEARKIKFEFLKTAKDLIDLLLSMGVPIDNPAIVESLNLLKYAISPEAEFSSMAIDFLKDWPHI